MLILPLLVFLSVSLALVGLYLWFKPSRAQQRAQALASPQSVGDWQQTAVKWVGPLARLSTPDADWDSSPLKIKFLQAGVRGEQAPLYYFGAKTVLPLLMAALMYLLLLGSSLSGLKLLLVISGVALCFAYVPNLVLWLMIRSRRREILNHFPDAVDLLLICMEAGLGLDAAMIRVTQEMSTSSRALAEEWHLTNLEVRAGATRELAMAHLALRTGLEEVASFALMLKQAEKFGISIGESLRVYSTDLRHKCMIRAEEAAATIPTKLLLPLVLFIFPSIIMVIMGPALIRILRTVMPLIGSTAS
jgi:tight adherence protein C